MHEYAQEPADRLGGLNKLLDHFYSDHASVTTVDEWLEQNEYHTATAHDAFAQLGGNIRNW